MSDDIVTRLRGYIPALNAKEVPQGITDMREAADEIELLRKESYVWEMAARQLAKELGTDEYADAAYQDEYNILEDNGELRYD